MNTHSRLAAFAAVLAFTRLTLPAQVPQLLNYQGRVAVGAVNFDGSGQFKFALVNGAGTTTYWSSSADTTPADGVPDAAVTLTVTKGLYSVLLGDTTLANMTAIPASVWSNADVRLRVWFNDGANGSQLLTPDQRLAPNGYLPSGSVSSAAIASGAVTAARLGSDVGLWSVNGADVFRNAGNVGIGKSDPATTLDVNGIVSATGFSGSGAALANVNAMTLGGLSSANFWKPAGNAGTTADTHFLGTTDDQALVFKVHGLRALRLEPNTNGAPNLIGGSPSNFVAAGAVGATIGGGGAVDYFGSSFTNGVTADFGTVGGGALNTSSGYAATVGGGQGNVSSGLAATVGGGDGNTSTGLAATVPGGNRNDATGDYSFAAGRRAKANHTGTFVWADGTAADFASSAVDQFLIRAKGGVGINKTDPATALDVNGTVTATAFAGDGAELTGLSAANLTGFLSDARLSTNVALLNANQTFSGTVTATGFSGSGAGLAGLSAASLTGTVSDLRLTSNVALRSGGNTFSGNQQFNSGNVGIGTAAPATPLEIRGATAAGPSLRLTGIGGFGSKVGIDLATFDPAVAGNAIPAARIEASDHNWSAGIDFQTKVPEQHGALTSRLFIRNDGNVGIGTIDPEARLSLVAPGASELDGSARSATLLTSAGALGIAAGDELALATIGFGSGNNSSLGVRALRVADGSSWSSTAIGLGMDVDNTVRAGANLWLHANGNVGIGTTTPSTKLEVSGTVTATGFSSAPGTPLLLGTTGSQPLEFYVNGTRALRLEPTAVTPNVIGGHASNWVAPGTVGATIAGGRHLGGSSGDFSTVGGGDSNFANGPFSTVGGGKSNGVTGDFATVPGGLGNVATGAYSFAAGSHARADHDSSFVWADRLGFPLHSTAADSVTMRASGGFRLFTELNSTLGVSLAPFGTAWAVISDRNVKKDFAPVDQRAILEKLAALPITQWHYKGEAPDVTPHIGPMAQDFKAAFYPGTDDKSITTQEADGVALAAIQGLNQKLEERLQEKDAKIAALERRLEKLERLMNRENEGGH